ncbi:MAG: PilN domain-containing protein [Solirubrobacterales bacterium]
MRPVNLIPPEERRGDRAPTRTGPTAYVIVGALAVAVAAVTAVVLTSNQIADRKEEVAALEVREAAAAEEAQSLAPYAEFASLKEARSATVESLARSRFDWERVLRELALVLPEGVQLTNVTGTVAAGLTLEGGAGNSLRDGIVGPALELSGCTKTQETVAELAASLEDIDGVTRVAVNRSATTDDSAAVAGGASSSTASCEVDAAVYEFEMIAAFDEVVVAATDAAPAAPGAEPATTAPVSDPAVADAQDQQQQARDSSSKQSGKARDAAENLVPGVAR